MRRLIVIGSTIAGAGLALLLGSCAGIRPANGLPPDWVQCEVQEAEDSDQETVVSGVPTELVVARGHTLHIPAGAVTAGTTITLRQLPTHGVDVQVTPAGLTVSPAATLTLVYAGRNCDIDDESAVAVWWKGTNVQPAKRLPKPPSVPTPGRVPGLVDHFSLFAIAK